MALKCRASQLSTPVAANGRSLRSIPAVCGLTEQLDDLAIFRSDSAPSSDDSERRLEIDYDPSDVGCGPRTTLKINGQLENTNQLEKTIRSGLCNCRGNKCGGSPGNYSVVARQLNGHKFSECNAAISEAALGVYLTQGLHTFVSTTRTADLSSLAGTRQGGISDASEQIWNLYGIVSTQRLTE